MAVVACSGPGLGAASPVGPAEPVGRVVDARGDERDETDVRSRRRKAGSGRPARDDGRLRRRGRPPGRRRRAWRGRPSETSTYSGGAGARPLRPGPLRTGMSPRLATSIQRPSPGPSVAPAGAGSSGSRRVRRWCGCGGSADDVAVGSFGQVDVGPVEEALPLDVEPRRTLSARRAWGTPRPGRPRGTCLHGWRLRDCKPLAARSRCPVAPGPLDRLSSHTDDQWWLHPCAHRLSPPRARSTAGVVGAVSRTTFGARWRGLRV